MADNEIDHRKLLSFQEVTGVKDLSLSHQILEAYGWDLDSAIHATVHTNTNADEESVRSVAASESAYVYPADNAGPGAGLVSGSSSTPPSLVGERSFFERIRDEATGGEEVQGPDGILLAGGLLNAGLGALRLSGVSSLAAEDDTEVRPNSASIVSVPSGASEAASFLRAYERRYGEHHPEFQAVSFMEALRRAGQELKFLFVYLHAPQYVNTPVFCETTLRDEAVVDFINANFIAWGADVHKTEGYQMRNRLNASTYPFCAIILASTDQRVSVVRQAEGFRTAGELMTILQNVIEEQSDSLIAGRREQEARDLSCRLREEQDEAYRIGLQADQERERREQAEEDQAAFDADRKKAQDEKEAGQAAYILARKQENLEQLRRDKALNLGPEPQGGADVTHVAVRLPSGERKQRRFRNTTTIQALYDYVESLNSFEPDTGFLLISNFPRVVYGPDMLHLTLKDAGLHPRTSLFVQVQDHQASSILKP